MSADGVLSYHLSPLTCGVAKFNLALAERLGVPMLGIFDPAAAALSRPLLSLKLSELLPADRGRLEALIAARGPGGYRVFFHDYGDSALERRMAMDAERLYCGNSALAATLRPLRGDVEELWCPGTLLDPQPLLPTEISVFSFGMSHKVRVDHYVRLRRLLDATGCTSSLWLSTALHDNTTFDGAFLRVLEDLRGVFADRLYFLGFLSDRAIHHFLSSATWFAAFFDRGVRANNTSVHVAMSCGAPVITNLDAHSPAGFTHLESVLDIERTEALPTDACVRERLRTTGAALAQRYGWGPLVERLGAG